MPQQSHILTVAVEVDFLCNQIPTMYLFAKFCTKPLFEIWYFTFQEKELREKIGVKNQKSMLLFETCETYFQRNRYIKKIQALFDSKKKDSNVMDNR